MSKKRASLLITLLALFAMVFTACAPAAPAGEGAAPAAEGEEPMTEVGTPRRETLIIDSLDAAPAIPPSSTLCCRAPASTPATTCSPCLTCVEMNTTTGEQFGGMAEDLARTA